MSESRAHLSAPRESPRGPQGFRHLRPRRAFETMHDPFICSQAPPCDAAAPPGPESGESPPVSPCGPRPRQRPAAGPPMCHERQPARSRVLGSALSCLWGGLAVPGQSQESGPRPSAEVGIPFTPRPVHGLHKDFQVWGGAAWPPSSLLSPSRPRARCQLRGRWARARGDPWSSPGHRDAE